MKPELAVLPLEVWADIFLSEYKWISRQELTEFANKMKNRNFAKKLDKLLHGCGRHTLQSLHIFSKPWNSERRVSIEVGYGFGKHEFPETEMPENIKSFKWLTIRYLDDEVLGFLKKIKPLFTNVYLHIGQLSIGYIPYQQTTADVRIFFTHLLPMLGGIRGIRCTNDCVDLLERHFPNTLTMAKELDLELSYPNPAFIPSYLDWLNALQNFDVDGPRFLIMRADSNTFIAMVDAVRQHFLAATTTATFVIFIDLGTYYSHSHHRAEEQTIQNGATNEQLTIRNACFEKPDYYSYGSIHYVEITRHTKVADAKMREWIEQRAFYEKKYKYHGAEQVISIGTEAWHPPTIGHITKKDEIDQAEDGTDAVEDEAGPSTSTKKMEKK